MSGSNDKDAHEFFANAVRAAEQVGMAPEEAMRNSLSAFTESPEAVRQMLRACPLPPEMSEERFLAIMEAQASAFDERTEEGRKNLNAVGGEEAERLRKEAASLRKAARNMSVATGIRTQLLDVCEYCAVHAPEAERFKRCARCQAVTYCSHECQKAHWKQGHKKACVPPTTPLGAGGASGSGGRDRSRPLALQEPAVWDPFLSAINGQLGRGPAAIAPNARADRCVSDWLDAARGTPSTSGSLATFRRRLRAIALGELWLDGPIEPARPPPFRSATTKKLKPADLNWFMSVCFHLASDEEPSRERYERDYGSTAELDGRAEGARVRREGTALRFLQIYEHFSDGQPDDAPSMIAKRAGSTPRGLLDRLKQTEASGPSRG